MGRRPLPKTYVRRKAFPTAKRLVNVKSKAAAQNLDFNQTITNMYCLCLKNKQEETSDVYEIVSKTRTHRRLGNATRLHRRLGLGFCFCF